MTVQVGGDAGGGGIDPDVEAGLVQAELVGKLRNGRGLILRDALEWGMMRRIGERERWGHWGSETSHQLNSSFFMDCDARL